VTSDDKIIALPVFITHRPMPSITSRPYTHPTDLPALMDLLNAVRPAEWNNEYPSIVDLQEAMVRASIREKTRLWANSQGDLAAFAFVLEPYNNLVFEVAPEAELEIEFQLIAWGMKCATRSKDLGVEDTLDTSCREDDRRRVALLKRQGFRQCEQNSLQMVRRLDQPISPVRLPEGFRIRSIKGEQEVDAIVALHRSAFGTSNMSREERLAIMRTPHYDPLLDLIVVAPDDRFAAYCTCTILAAENKRSGMKIGHTDPVAVHPDFQRQGLARALLLNGSQLLKERGMEMAMLSTSSDNLAMQRAAESAGFRVYSKRIWFSKTLTNHSPDA
jgi:ribosomal protein S18 acetylase RimI-like enzyme